MTSVAAIGTVFLPFTLNVCAIGPAVEPLHAHVEEADVVVQFPPSMTEGAVGKSIYPDGWAWWVVDRLNVESSASLESLGGDFNATEQMRDALLDAAQVAVRRLLNSYRWRLSQPQVHPVKIDAAQFSLEIIHEDGSRDMLPEPVGSFFFNRTPEAPPLDKSITHETLIRLGRDVLDGVEPPHNALLALDIAWLKSIGEEGRAAEMEQFCTPSEDVNIS